MSTKSLLNRVRQHAGVIEKQAVNGSSVVLRQRSELSKLLKEQVDFAVERLSSFINNHVSEIDVDTPYDNEMTWRISDEAIDDWWNGQSENPPKERTVNVHIYLYINNVDECGLCVMGTAYIEGEERDFCEDLYYDHYEIEFLMRLLSILQKRLEKG